MLPEELKRFAIGYSQDIFNAGQEMDTYQEKLKDSIIKFTKRPYTNFIDAKTDEEDFTEWLNDEIAYLRDMYDDLAEEDITIEE